MLQWLFGKEKDARAASAARHGRPEAPPSQFAQSSLLAVPASTRAARKELLALILRETLSHNGIPLAWMGADTLNIAAAGQEPGLHVRFVVRQWDERLMVHAMALQDDYVRRLLLLDPNATAWLRGFSWQFALPEESEYPRLPHPGAWTAAPHPADPRGGSPSQVPAGADVISGPVLIARLPSPTEGGADDSGRRLSKDELDQWLSARDEEHRRFSPPGAGNSYKPTEPAGLP